MKSRFRSLALGLAALLGTAAMAQQPNTIEVIGTVLQCTPGDSVHIETVQGTVPQYSFWVPLDSNCMFFAQLGVATPVSFVQATVPCGGILATVWDSVVFNGQLDTAYMSLVIACGGGGTFDCLGVLNGPNMPGTPCNDGNPMTTNDTWTPNCVCAGTPPPPSCEAAFLVQQQYVNNVPVPFSMITVNQSTGQNPITYQWWMPDGSPSGAMNPSFLFTSPGTYGICLTITAGGNCTSTLCDTIVVDSAGVITTPNITPDCLGNLGGTALPGTPCQIPGTFITGIWSPNCVCDTINNLYDCLGILNGPNVPGTACSIPGVGTGIWDANCMCDTLGGAYDCNGVLNGPAMPGTACTDTINGVLYTGNWSINCQCIINGLIDCLGVPGGNNMPGAPCNDGDSLTVMDTWTPNCQCVGVYLNPYDCLGVLNGPDLPGTPCDDGNPATTNDMWDANCNCVGNNNSPCQAEFFVLQAYDIDSVLGPSPIPNELWIWNLSNGGSGTYSFLWNFGDGTSSTDPFPTHTYANSGPYVLCLTIDDGQNCISTYCDTVAMDANGLYTGLVSNSNDRGAGFTINVQNPGTNSIASVGDLHELATWPNPVNETLNIAFSSTLQGAVNITILDVNGRIVHQDRAARAAGRNQMVVPTHELGAGMYLLRIGTGEDSISLRFVKAR